MNKRLLFLPIIALIATSLLAADTVVEEIVARVNSDIITRGDYERSKADLLNEDKQRLGASDRPAGQEKDVLRDLIDQDLLVQKGKDLGITADTELIKRLDDMRKQMHLNSMEDLEKAAQEQGISFEDFKQNLRNQIITQQVIGKEVGSHMQISEAEVKQYYDAHAKEMEQPEQIRLSEILVSTQPAGADPSAPAADPSPDVLAAAQTKADDLLQQIKGGAKFEEVAQKSSDGPTAADGGDLGAFKRGMLAKELEDVTFALKPGEVSNVIRTRQGFVILKVTEHTPAGIPPLKDVTQQIQDQIYYTRLQPALRTYLTKLREDAYIDIMPGYEDSAASPNETKPVYTTGAAEKPKPKKKKKHFLII